MPNYAVLHTSKEAFVEALRTVYSKRLAGFREISQVRIEGHACAQVRFRANPNNYSIHNIPISQDPSNEYFHIFYAQVNRFLNSMIILLREVHNNFPSLFKLTLIDANQSLETACKDLKKITDGLCNGTGMNCEAISFAMYKEKMINDNILNKYMSEYTDGSRDSMEDFGELQDSPTRRENEPNESKANQQAKTKKKKKKEVSIGGAELDKEIEEFTLKLELESTVKDKIRPNFTEDWISDLRKKLKDRIS